MRGIARLLLAVVLIGFPRPVPAPTIVVDNTTCTLAQAVRAANTDTAQGGCAAGSGADTLVLTADVSLRVPYAHAYGSDTGLPLITSEIAIDGRGLTIERAPDAPAFRLLAVAAGGTLGLRDLRLTGGQTQGGGGGAIYNAGTTLLTNSTVSGTLPPSYGGVIRALGDLTLDHSSIEDNPGDAIAIYGTGGADLTLVSSSLSGNGMMGIRSMGGIVELIASSVSANDSLGIYSRNGVVLLNQTTVSGNGVGVYAYYGSAILTNSTVSGNANDGVRLYYDSGGTLKNTTITGNGRFGVWAGYDTYPRLENSIVSANAAGNCYADDYSGSEIVDNGGNFSDDGTCGAGFQGIAGLDPVLADNGGATQTHALLPDSTAIDATGDCGLATDQRGIPRNDDACDSGSYEFQCSIRVDPDPGGTQIFFTPDSSGFDLVCGFLSDLQADGDFAGATCLGTFVAGPAIDTLAEPPGSDGRYYLARGLTSCVGAFYGDSSLVPDPRDALNSGPCP
jgi:parallel beta-helix repeat protein